MRKTLISFYLNGDLIEKQLDPEGTVLSLLRNILWKTGTKEGCGDGDCGACTIAQAFSSDNKIVYSAVNSCLMPVGKLQGSSIVTIEGIEQNDDLNIIQEAMVDEHGLQCGFCSPGVSMSMFALLANGGIPSYLDLKSALNGHICRCTGYEGIRNAAKEVLIRLKENPSYEIVPSKIREVEGKLLSMERNLEKSDYLIPLSIDELKKDLKSEPSSMIVSGCSDVSARTHETKESLLKVIDVSRVQEMDKIELSDEGLFIGGSSSLTSIINSPLVQKNTPQLSEGLKEIAAQQVRNLATLAGNIANASPIADGVVILLSYNAKLIIESSVGQRQESLANFYKGYKTTTLKKGEVIVKILIPSSSFNRKYHMEKTGKRNTVDIACVSSCASYIERNNSIQDLIIAFGGIAATVVVENLGTIEKDSNINELALKIAEKYNPLSDVRGSSEYRKKLIENHIIKHFLYMKGEL